MKTSHMPINKKRLQVGVVGPCAAGKSTLIKHLTQAGYHARHIAQEHSYVADMWQRLSNPAILIYLDISYAGSIQRRPTNMSMDEFSQQLFRLRHAREHADFFLDTSQHTIEGVAQSVIAFLKEIGQSPDSGV